MDKTPGVFMKLLIVFFFFLLSIVFACSYPRIPNVSWSPGHKCTTENPDFREYRYAEKIPYCGRNVSSKTKLAIYNKYNIPLEDRKNYTIDHVIPLSLGGSNSVSNLWSEHKAVKATRPNLENELYIKMKNNEITQLEAINIILKAKFQN
jgi:hypothetical protein